MVEEMEPLGEILAKLTSQNISEGEQGNHSEPSHPSCVYCQGAQWVRVDVPFGDPRWGEIEPCICWESGAQGNRSSGLLRYSNLGALTRFTFDNIQSQGLSDTPKDQALFEEAIRAAIRFSESPQGWILLTGPSGCGKTHLAAAVAHRTVSLGHPTLFMVVPDLLDHLRSAFVPDSDSSYDLLSEQLYGTPLLILDDLGAQASTPWASEKLFQVLNHRYNAELATLITIAVPIETLEDRLKTRLLQPSFSRIFPLRQDQEHTGLKIGSLPVKMQDQMKFGKFETKPMQATRKQQESLQVALQAAQNFADHPDGSWLVIQGDTGRGKTHLASAIVNEIRENGNEALFVRVPDFLDHLRATYGPHSPVTYDQVFERVKDSRMLVLDDLGSQSATPWAEEKLFQLLVHRHDNQLTTVITMPRTLSISAPLASRLGDVRGIIVLVEIDAPDYRNTDIRSK